MAFAKRKFEPSRVELINQEAEQRGMDDDNNIFHHVQVLRQVRRRCYIEEVSYPDRPGVAANS